MINAGKILPHVAFQSVSSFLGKLLEPVQGHVRPFPLAGRIGIVNEHRIENWLQNVVDRVMNNAVPVGGSTDHTFLRLKNKKMVVPARLVSFGPQLMMELPQLFLQKEIEPGRRVFETLAALGQTGGL